MQKNPFVWLSLALVGIFMLASAFTPSATTTPDAPTAEFFVVKVGNEAMTKAVKTQLRRAYMAQHGRNAKLSKIEIIRHKGKPFLVFQSGGSGSPTMAIQLSRIAGGKMGFGANSAKNTCTGAPCSWCYFDSSNGCVCNADGGGTCNHTQESLQADSRFLETLSM